MLILITFILLFIGVALTYNVYSIFKPFIENLGNIQQYNIAYYGAISSIERAELVLRHHTAGFEGSGGWLEDNIGPSSDGKISNFGLLSKSNNGMIREIKSRINGDSIPIPGKGNIDYDLQRTQTDYGGKSEDFNKLTYNLSEEFLLYYDNTTDENEYYTGDKNQNIIDIKPSDIKVTLRLPPKISDMLDGSKDNQPQDSLADNIDLDGDGITDDIAVNRSLFGYDQNSEEFTILPTINLDYDNNQVQNGDTAIREDVINKISDNPTQSISFENNKNPICNVSDYSSCQKPNYHNIIPSYSTFSGKNFQYIFQNGSKLHLKFSIVNLLKDSDGNIFPFLEYKLKFDGISTIPDRFFHINGIGKVGYYKVIIHLEKPVVKSTSASDFTILF